MREAAEDEPGVSAVPRGGGSVEAETRIAISWSIIASRSAVKAAVPGPRSGSLSRQGATGSGVARNCLTVGHVRSDSMQSAPARGVWGHAPPDFF